MPHVASQILTDFDRRWTLKELDNGLRLLHIPLAGDERFYFGSIIAAGARYEAKAVIGVAHFLEHMMFRGSKNYPSFAKLADAFEWLGGEWNAATGYEHTEYWFSGHRRSSLEAIALFAEFLCHPRFGDIEIERDIIKRELQKELNELGLSTDIDYHSQCQIWPKSNLARPILGDVDNISRLSLAELKRYREQHYAPGNMILCAVGGEPGDELLDAMSRAFAGYGRGTRTRLPPRPVAPGRYRGPKFQWVENPDNEYQIQVSFPCRGEWSADAVPAQMISRILADGFTSRLSSHLRERLGLVYDIDAGANLFSDVGTIDITAAVGPDEIEVFFRELMKILKTFREKGPLAREVERAVLRTHMDLELVPSDPESLGFRWSWALLNGKTPSLVKSSRRISAVDRAQIAALAAKVFKPTNLSLVALGPKNVELARRVEAIIKAKL